MKKTFYKFSLGLVLTTLTFSLTSCGNDKTKTEDSSNELNEAKSSLSNDQIESETTKEYESPTFTIKYKGQDWEVNKAEWEEWKVKNAEAYEGAIQETNRILAQEEYTTLDYAKAADDMNGYLDMEMIGANRMPMSALMIIQVKNMYLHGGDKGFK